MRRILLVSCLSLSAILASTSSAAEAHDAPFYPGTPPGAASARAEGGRLELANHALTVAWTLDEGRLRPLVAVDRASGRRLALEGEAFELVLADGGVVAASDLRARGEARVEALVADPQSARLAERSAGRALVVELVDPEGAFEVRWRAILRDGSNAVRQEVRVRAGERAPALERLVLGSFVLPADAGAHTVGAVKGSPVVARPFFLAAENPLAENRAAFPARPLGTWSPAEVAQEPRELGWDLTLGVEDEDLAGGPIEVLFQYTGGAHRLDVFGVTLLEDGRAVARDEHHGHTGSVDVDNRWTLQVPAHDPWRRYRIVASVSADGGNDSNGEVLVARLGGAPPVTCSVPVVALEPGEELVESAVLGVVPEGQLRRGFLYWLERERAHPYRPFLHYNSWYDIGFFDSFDEADALGVIEAFGRELVEKRSVAMDSFLMDDGWDDHASLWDFHAGFPDGFAKVRAAAERYGAAPGVWFSPWGGYGKPREERLAAGKERGYETNADGFVLAAPRYFERIRAVCLDMLRKGGVNQFKLDGISRASERWPGSRFASDFQAAIALISDLRAEKPDLFVNLTTGTWPSPFWLRFADSIWRGGYDHEFAGVGSDRQRWMTYRDGQTYRNVVRAGPLFPLSSLMVHGVIHARHARQLGAGTAGPAGRDLRDEIRTAFGMGTQLQELYITPALLDERGWDDLAEAARWSRASAGTLRDTHWVGGDPLALEVYGWAAWSPEKAVLTLRNPSDEERDVALEPAEAFELPADAPRAFEFTSPFSDQRVQALSVAAGEPLALRLRPFEVLVLEARSGAALEPALVPLPTTLETLPGRLRLDERTRIVCVDEDARGVAEALAARLRPSTGLALPVVAEAEDGDVALRLLLDPALEADLGAEGYRLESSEEGARFSAAAPAGLFYALQTFCQLLPPAVDSPELVTDTAWEASCVRIEDRPRFAWRGLMLDTARHWFPVDFVRRTIDLAARHKLNRFHWHLTDDQGWRIEIRSHPELVEVGARRAETPLVFERSMGDGAPYAGSYTQAEIRDVVAYAAERFVTVVPEIELPGHALAALASDPSLSCSGGPFAVGTRWGVFEDVYCAGNDAVFAFLEDVLGEVCELFPGPWVHVGGDECPKTRWQACPRCQERIRIEGLADEHELQAWFVERVGRLLEAHDKRLIGWDEILEGHLAPGATVMSWRGFEGGIAAARQGHDVVMSPTSHCYLDYYQAEPKQGEGIDEVYVDAKGYRSEYHARPAGSEPPAIGGLLTLETAYAFEPLPEQLDEAAASHVLGAQGNLWTEYVPSGAHAEYMLFPRACALAERVWSAADVRDFDDFRRRLSVHLERLEAQEVHFRALDPRD